MKESTVGRALKALIETRVAGGVLVGAAALQALIVSLELPGHRCLFRRLTGLPCLGCGISRGIAATVRGDWPGVLATHPFSPYFLLLGALLGLSALLGREHRRRLAEAVCSFERHTHLNTLLLVAFAAYGFLRILVHAGP
jgi:hypothetical protein